MAFLILLDLGNHHRDKILNNVIADSAHTPSIVYYLEEKCRTKGNEAIYREGRIGHT